MAPRISKVKYGDSLRLQPQLSKIVDRAVVKFVNRHNGEPDLKGFDDPLFHLPKPTDPVSRMRTYRRWHGADWWMVLCDDVMRTPVIGMVTKRVTILPDSSEPDTLNFSPELVVTRGGAQLILPEYKAQYREYSQQVSLFDIYRSLILGTGDSEDTDDRIIDTLSKAWEFHRQISP